MEEQQIPMDERLTMAMREGLAGMPSRRSLRRLVQAVEVYTNHPYIVAVVDEEPLPRLTWEETQELPLHEALSILGDELHAMAEALEAR